MTSTPLGQYFTTTVSSAEVERGKPHPHVYQEAISRLGSRSDRSYAVEDSSNGIRAAAAAGLTVLGIEHPQYPVDLDAAGRTLGIYNSLEHVADVLLWFLDEGQAS
jgi:beta-phosphoglucomutase-like phosphatase (HAD superfamily)